jgi:hypothetical protein
MTGGRAHLLLLPLLLLHTSVMLREFIMLLGLKASWRQ